MKYDEIAILVLLASSLLIVNNIAGKRPSQTKTLSNLTSPRTPIITPIMTLFSLDLRRDLSLAKIAMQRTKSNTSISELTVLLYQTKGTL